MTLAKAIAAALVAILAAVLPGILDEGMGVTEWINVAILALGAVQVYNAANIPGWRYAKLIAATLSAGAVVASSALSLGISTSEWVQIAIAALGAFAVYQVPNAGEPHLGRPMGGARDDDTQVIDMRDDGATGRHARRDPGPLT